jgi:hypothetical protein
MATKETENRALPEEPLELRRFLHDVSTPLSAVALHLETAARRVRKGEDPLEPLETARRELARAFELFERGREALTVKKELSKGRTS